MSADDLGTVTRSDLPGALGATVFEQPEGEVGAPVESPFGWHLFRVSAIEPEVVTPLDEVRDELARELQLAEARDRLPGFANQLDDELAAGLPVAEAAGALGLEAETVTVDRQGQNESGERPDALPSWPKLLETAFATPAEETSLLEETDDGNYFVVSVDAVTPSRIRPVDEVRDALIAAWTAEQRRSLAQEKAERLLAQAGEVASLEQLAGQAGADVAAITPVKRNDRGTEQGINPAVVQALFATEAGAIADQVMPTGTGFALVATDRVIEADPGSNPDALAQLRRELENETRSDLLSQFEDALRRDYPVEIDGAAINRLIDPDDLGGYGPTG